MGEWSVELSVRNDLIIIVSFVSLKSKLLGFWRTIQGSDPIKANY